MANQIISEPLVDSAGCPLFTCHYCDRPLSAWDISSLGLRAPGPGEGADEYCEAELLDAREMVHLACLERAR